MPIDNEKLLAALKLMRESSKKRKFVQSVDLAITLRDIDPKKPAGRIKEEVILPHGAGKPRRVGVFAEGELARQARDAGADPILGRADIEALRRDRKKARKVAESCDSFLAQADLMVLIAKALGPVLGPRGKMPKPIPPTANPKPFIERLKKTVQLRTKEQPDLHVQIGSENMSDEQLAANAQAVFGTIEHRLERGLDQVRSVYVKMTMGKPAKVEV